MSAPASLAAGAVRVLGTADPAEKTRLSAEIAEGWRSGRIAVWGKAAPPDRPARPARPVLLAPRAMPRRRAGGAKGRIALLHALAHIELNAVDLAWDIIARFADCGLPRAFADDWLHVAAQEAQHFRLLARRLGDYGAAYGDLPAHDGLWQAAEATSHDVLARLALVPLVLEARGLDVTPAMIDRFAALGDPDSAALLGIIYRDEIGHVATGRRWFETLCRARALDPVPTWQALVTALFKGALKPPFNDDARGEAGFPPDFYRPLAAAGASVWLPPLRPQDGGAARCVGDDPAACRIGQVLPGADLLDRAQAAEAPAGGRVEAADFDAGRRDGHQIN